MTFLSVNASCYNGQPPRRTVAYTAEHEEFIPKAHNLWNQALELRQSMLDSNQYDPQRYCAILQDMLNAYPSPVNHIWDYIYTGIDGREDVPAEVEFMRDIYTELMWAFETDNV